MIACSHLIWSALIPRTFAAGKPKMAPIKDKTASPAVKSSFLTNRNSSIPSPRSSGTVGTQLGHVHVSGRKFAGSMSAFQALVRFSPTILAPEGVDQGLPFLRTVTS